MEQAAINRFEKAAPPRDPRTLWSAAVERHRQGDADGAAELYQRHLRLYPQDAEAWMNLGAALRASTQLDAAMVCYQRVLRLRPRDAGVWSNLGNLWTDLDQHAQSLRCHRRAVELQPHALQLHLNHAAALHAAARFEEAEVAIEAGLDAAPDHPALLWARAIVRLHQARYAEAWPDFEARLVSGVERLPPITAPRWCGERIGGKRLLLLAESGRGDTLWAARFIGMLDRRGADVTLACPRVLHPVLCNLPARLVDSEEPGIARERFDFHCPLMSLPGCVDPRGLSIPAPHAFAVPEKSRHEMERRIAACGDHFRIGIVWSGSAAHPDRARRTVPLQSLLQLGALPSVQLFSLQAGSAAEHMARLDTDQRVVDLGTHLHDFGDTAAAVEKMDLIIAAESAVAHLASALGIPMLMVLPYTPGWIYGTHGGATPWYPSMHLLRQAEPGNWDKVFREMMRRVRACVKGRERERRLR
jgi:Tfp pilus assembly protein PilF